MSSRSNEIFIQAIKSMITIESNTNFNLIKMNGNQRERFAKLLSSMRGDRSYREFARIVGVSQSTLHNWENVIGDPDLAQLEKVARILKLTMPELITYIYTGEKIGMNSDSISQWIDVADMHDVSRLLKSIGNRIAER